MMYRFGATKDFVKSSAHPHVNKNERNATTADPHIIASAHVLSYESGSYFFLPYMKTKKHIPVNTVKSTTPRAFDIMPHITN